MNDKNSKLLADLKKKNVFFGIGFFSCQPPLYWDELKSYLAVVGVRADGVEVEAEVEGFDDDEASLILIRNNVNQQ